MNPVNDLIAAWRGWVEIVTGSKDSARHFTPTMAGLTIALVWLAIAALLSTAVQSAAVGMPSTGQILIGLVAQAITVGLLAIAMAQALHFLKSPVPLTVLLVPVIYALALTFLVSIPLSALGPGVALLAMLALAGLIFRGAQIVAGMKTPAAAGFAAVCLLVLVVVPNALYMVVLVIPSPA